MSKTNLGLVAFCKEALKNDTGYVYGTLGQICTKSLLDQCAARYPANHLAGGDMRKMGEKWLGRRVTDCIGLLKYYMMSSGYGESPKYNAKYDKSANGAYAEATEKGFIKTMPDIPGICLHMDGHFGVYIGNGQVIEARGTYYGVVETQLKDRPWTHWFKSPWLEYIVKTIDPMYSDTTMAFTKHPGETYQFKTGSPITCGTGSVFQPVGFTKRDTDGYYLTTFKAVGKGTAGFYLKGTRICVAHVV